jgi:1-acyl-sn-glycerol-3-phosphate acyltransferase
MKQYLLHPLSRWILNSLSVTVTGLDNIDPSENYIFAMNHQSVIDIPVAYSLITLGHNRPLTVLMSHRFYRFLWPLVAPLGTISIDMDRITNRAIIHNRRMLAEGSARLAKGKNILIYPEGIITGGLDNRIIKGYTGTVRLSARSKRPVIPIGISGSNLVYPFLLYTRNPFKLRRKSEIKVTFGPKITFDHIGNINLETYSEENRKILRNSTDQLMQRLSQLSGLPYSPEN